MILSSDVLLRIVRPLAAGVQTSSSCSISRARPVEATSAFPYLLAIPDSPEVSESCLIRARSSTNSDRSCGSISSSRFG